MEGEKSLASIGLRDVQDKLNATYGKMTHATASMCRDMYIADDGDSTWKFTHKRDERAYYATREAQLIIVEIVFV